MDGLMRRGPASPDFADLLGWPFTSDRPGMHSLRVEDSIEDGRYVVRAEIPGIDPEKDVDITLSRGTLTIRAERREEQKGKRRSEFRYGSFARTVALPDDADESDVQARYVDGILEVNVPLAEPREETKKITVDKG